MIRDDKLVKMVNRPTLPSQEVNLVQKSRHPVELNQIDDVVLLCESLESQLELLVLVHAVPAELRLAAAAAQTAAESA